jgi:dihydroorotate dehydrogenase (fumarate)
MVKAKFLKTMLNNCILNASGALCETRSQLLYLDKSNLGGIVAKTCTFESREGNPEPRYYSKGDVSINSMGLPNLGHEFYIKMSEKLTKPYIVSISPMDLEKFKEMFDKASQCDEILAIEVNMSCPNIIGSAQIGYDLEEMEKILKLIGNSSKQFGLKLPPYFDQFYFQRISTLLEKYGVSFITCINSLGNGLIIDPKTESVVIKPKEGIGGIGGSIIKPIALSNIYQFRKALPPSIEIIGCGGIKTGMDIFEHILVGATIVQIGTVLVDENLECVDRLDNELKDIMKKKGYKTLEDFRGKIKRI